MADKNGKGDSGDKRKEVDDVSQFQNSISADGEFPPEANRYHLYVSLACPWAHRAIIGRSLKGLEDVISMSVVDWVLDRKIGWAFNPKHAGCTADEANDKQLLREVYEMAKPGYEGRITVPVLWDKKKKTIVNNDSAAILRMLETQFDQFGKTDEQKKLDLYPVDLRKNIDEIDAWVQQYINGGVYKAGFSKTQKDYDEAVKPLFEHLDKAEKLLGKNRFVAGKTMTEADIRLFTTCLRFDIVYYVLFKCNKKHIWQYPNLWGWVKEMYQIPAIRKTVDWEHINNLYYLTFADINPFSIVPVGPEIDFDEPHDRHTK